MHPGRCAAAGDDTTGVSHVVQRRGPSSAEVCQRARSPRNLSRPLVPPLSVAVHPETFTGQCRSTGTHLIRADPPVLVTLIAPCQGMVAGMPLQWDPLIEAHGCQQVLQELEGARM